MREKRCSKCNTTQPVTNFTVKNAATGQLKSVCKKCSNAIATAWKEDNKERDGVSRSRPKFVFSPILKKFLERNVQMPNFREELVTISAYPCAGMTEEGIFVTSKPVERVCRPRYGHPTIVLPRSEE